MPELSAKQRTFVQEYLIDLNATQAAIRAGYSEKTAKEQGSQLLTKLHIQQAVAAGQAEREERTLITQDDVVRGLLAEAQFMGEGSSHSARVSAWGHLSKHTGGFSERHIVEVNKFDEMDDEQLAAHIARLQSAAGSVAGVGKVSGGTGTETKH